MKDLGRAQKIQGVKLIKKLRERLYVYNIGRLLEESIKEVGYV